MLNILTIDWDYVIKTALGVKTWAMMPDSPNEQFSHTVHDTVWLSMYGGMHKLERDWDIEISCEPGYHQLASLIENMHCNTKDIAYGITHMLAYPYIISKIGHSNEPFRLINIDFHCDMRPIRPTEKYVDCGNWVPALAQTGLLKEYTWIRNPESSLKEFEQFSTPYPGFDTYSYTWDNYMSLNNGTPIIDYVFICKSPAWAPPHLDKYFLSLLDVVSERFNLISVDTNDTDRELIKCDRFLEYENDGSLQAMKQIYAGYSIPKGEWANEPE